MQARILTGPALERARNWARERALDQALLLADLTQLAEDSLPAGVIVHFADNLAAQRLYARIGFVPHARLLLTRFRLSPAEATEF